MVVLSHADWFQQRFGATETGSFLFPFGTPLPIDPTRPITTIKHAWETLRDIAEVKCRFHDLRHTAITKLAESGAPEGAILALAGHVSRSMLERYSHVRIIAKRDAVEALTLADFTPVPEKVPSLDCPATVQ